MDRIPSVPQINSNPCTSTQLGQNFGNIVTYVQALQNQIDDSITDPTTIANYNAGLDQVLGHDGSGGFQWEDPTAGTDVKVKVNAADTADYLQPQILHSHAEASPAYTVANDYVIYSDAVNTAGDRAMLFYIDASLFTGWTGAAEEVLGWSGAGAPKVLTFGLTKWDSADTADYLSNQFSFSAAYDSAMDIQVPFDTNTTHAGKLFADMSTVSGYDATKNQILLNKAGAVKWVTVTSTTVVTDVSWDTGTCVMTKTTETYYLFHTLP